MPFEAASTGKIKAFIDLFHEFFNTLEDGKASESASTGKPTVHICAVQPVAE